MTATTDAVRSVTGRAGSATASQRAVDRVVDWLSRRTTRRGFLMRTAVVGSALTVDTVGFALRPGSAYASVCGPASSCGTGWTVFCATINKGVNDCPPGSIAAGWWKADGASLCGGRSRYIVDCNATCSRCHTPSGRAGICAPSCWSCSCRCGPSGQCDQRRVCCNAFRYGQCNEQVHQVGSVVCRIASCVPPWTFANCTTAAATDNRTVDHSAPLLPGPWSAIRQRYLQLHESAGPLGPSVGAEFAITGGRGQRYLRGRMSYASRVGVHYVAGPTATRYHQLGDEIGVLGFPTADPVVLGTGRASSFQRGRISWHPSLGAFETLGPIAVRYTHAGAESGVLAFPTDHPRIPRDGTGRYSTFQGGRISWHPVVGAHLVQARIARRFAALGGESGQLGYPTGDESTTTTTSRSAPFQHGRIISIATQEGIALLDLIALAYARAGNEPGVLGLPGGPESPVAGGRVQLFEQGRISAAADGGAFWCRGPIADAFVANGAEAGPLGFPTDDEVSTQPGQRVSTFQHGSISYDEGTQTTTVTIDQPPPPSPQPSTAAAPGVA